MEGPDLDSVAHPPRRPVTEAASHVSLLSALGASNVERDHPVSNAVFTSNNATITVGPSAHGHSANLSGTFTELVTAASVAVNLSGAGA